jgi:Ca-activated chloride channel homolog
MRLVPRLLVSLMLFGNLASRSGLEAQDTSPRSQSTASLSPVPVIAPLTIGAGEHFVLLLETGLNSASSRAGDRVLLRTNDDIRVGNSVAIPQRSEINATVTRVQRPGRLKGRAEIQLRFQELRLANGTSLPLKATLVHAGFAGIKGGKDSNVKLKGERGNGGSISAVGQGAMQGALVGVLMGGGKGAAIGSASGAAVGLASVMLKRGPELDLPRDMLFEIELNEPLHISQTAADQAVKIARADRGVISNPSTADRATSPAMQEAEAEPVPDFTKEQAGADAGPKPVEVAKVDTPPTPLPNPSQTPPPVFDEPSPDDYKLRVDVQLVMVDTMVRDRTGRPMDGLHREDFLLFEDGVEQKIQSFSRDELPLAVALVVDRSGSVATYMNELRRSAYRALSQLKQNDKVALFTFDSEVQRVEGLTSDRQRIADRIATIRAGGGTNIIDALFDAAYYLSAVARDRRRVVILVSDNVATTKPRSSQSQLIRLAMESETVIYSIKTPGEEIPVTMRIPVWLGGNGSVPKVTHETGGEIIDVQSVGSLDSALATVVNRLKLRYTLGYQPSRKSSPTFHKIDVRLSDRFGHPESDYSVHARRGYYSSDTASAQKNP